MPKGKPLIGGYVYSQVKLGDCSCFDWLLGSQRKNSPPKLSGERKNSLRKKINNAAEEYIGAKLTSFVREPLSDANNKEKAHSQFTRTNRTQTETEIKNGIKKIRLAAVNLLASTADDIGYAYWLERLLNSLSLTDLGTHAKYFLHRLILKKGGDIYHLAEWLENTSLTDPDQRDPIHADQTAHKTLKALVQIDVDTITVSNNYPVDPILLPLVAELSSIWVEVTGRKPLPKSVSGSAHEEKEYWFAEWLQQIILTAKSASLELKDIEVPKLGTILDVVHILEK